MSLPTKEEKKSEAAAMMPKRKKIPKQGYGDRGSLKATDPIQLDIHDLYNAWKNIVPLTPPASQVEAKETTSKLGAQQSKGTILLGAWVWEDGVGDYSHFRDFLREIRIKYPQYKVVGVIALSPMHPSYKALKANMDEDFPNKDYIELPRKERPGYTEAYKAYIEWASNQDAAKEAKDDATRKQIVEQLAKKRMEEAIAQANEQINKVLESEDFVTQLDVSRGAVANTFLRRFIDEHGGSRYERRGLTSSALSMGLESGGCGVKIPKEILPDSPDARARALVQIGRGEQAKKEVNAKKAADAVSAGAPSEAKGEQAKPVTIFKLLTGQELSGNDKANAEVAKDYLEKHHFMIGYLQAPSDCALFVAAQVLRYRDDKGNLDKPCDFHLPNKFVNQKVIIEQLERCGIKAEEVEFVNSSNEASYQPKPQCKVRIFSNRIEDEENWKLLFQVSKDGAAASGDNSVEQVYGARHIPFITSAGDMMDTWTDGPQSVAKELNDKLKKESNDAENLDALIEYFSMRFRKREIEIMYFAKPEERIDCVNERANDLATYLKKNPGLQKQWERLHRELTTRPEYNTYNWLPLLLTSSIRMRELYDHDLISLEQLKSFYRPEVTAGPGRLDSIRVALLMRCYERMLRDDSNFCSL